MSEQLPGQFGLADYFDTEAETDPDEAPNTSLEPDLGELPDAVDDDAERFQGAALDDDEDPGEAEPDDPFAVS